MAEKTPVRVNYDNSNNPIGFAEFQADDFIGLDDGGTGGSYASLAELLSGIGLGTGDTPTFTGLLTSGDVTIGGNLTVDGTTTTVNSTIVTIDDPIFTLGGDAELASDDNKDRGIEFRWHDGTGSKIGFFGFDDSTGNFTFIPDATNTAEVFSGTVGTIQANIQGNVTGTVSSISNFDTDDLAEGAINLYFTEERVDDRVAALLVDSTTSGIDISYDDVNNQLTISTDLSEIIESLQDNVQGLFSGGTGITTNYDDAANTLSLSIDFTEFTSDDIVEGSTNLFVTDERIDDRINALLVDSTTSGIDISYDDVANSLTLSVDLSEIVEALQDNVEGLFSGGTGITTTYDDAANTLSLSIDFTEFDTDDLVEGVTNLFHTTERVQDVTGEQFVTNGTHTGISFTYDDANDGAIDATVSLASFDTGDLAEGSNLYYTDSRVGTYLTTNNYATQSYVDSAVASENEISEMNDVTLTSLATGEFLQYNGTAWVNVVPDTDDITEGTNLFFTEERVDDRVAGLLTAGSNITLTYDDAAGTLTIAATEDDLSNNTTDDLAEGSTNLYFTNERAQDAVGAMLSGNTETLISVTYDDANNIIDFVVDNDLSNYDNTTSAFIDLTDLSVATGSGLTYNNLTGEFGTSAIPNAQLANDSITINSYSTALGSSVTLVTDDIAEDGSPINLWYTDARARASISVTDAGGDGSLSYNSSTGVITYTGPSQSEVLAHISGGTGVSIDAAGVISIGQAVGTTDNVTFNNVTVDGTLNSDDITATTMTVSNDLVVTGDLTVQGTTTTLNTDTVSTEENMIKLASGNTGNSTDIGIYGKVVQSSTTKYVGLHWDPGVGQNKFKLFDSLTVEPTGTVDTADASYTKATLVANIEGDVTGALTGNASTATALASSQNFSLTGDVTATAVSFDGTGAVALSTTIASGAVEFSMIDGAAVITGTETISSNSTDDTALTTSKAVYDFVTGQGYLTSFTETNDLTAAVTWANVPDANITQSSVTQHQAALAINESQITFTSSFLENLVEDLTPQLGGTLDANGNTIDMGVNVITDTKVGQWDTAYSWGDHASAGYLTSYTETDPIYTASSWYTTTNNSTNWDTAYGWGDHSAAGYLTSFTETNDLTAAVTWANVPDANITQSSVTQHEAALSITESQITDLGSYITATSTDTLTNKTINFEDNTAIIEFAVTVSNPGAGNKYYLDGELSANIQLIPGVTYRFDQSDSSNSTHPLVFSTTSESSGVTSYTTGVTTNGTPGSAGAYTQIVVNGATADKLYYYCSSHSGMGGGIVSIQGSSFVAGTGISISGETISSTITQYADADVEAYLSGGTGVTFSSGVISIGQAVGTSDNVTFNDLIVSGNLTVSGTTTTVNTETINLADNIILFNSNETGTPLQDAGIEIERGTSTNVSFLWDEANDRWTVGAYDLVAANFIGNVTGDVTGDIDGAVIITGKNESGSTIAAGVPVYISGQASSGTEFTVAPADADGSGTMPAIGITTASSNNNSSVSILTFGKFVGLNTSSFSVGDELYVSTTGTLTNTAPTGETASLQKIAKVTRSHATDGAIFVQGAGRTNAVPNLDNGDIFIGNGSNQAVTASFNTTVDGYLSGGTGIDYTTGTISVDSTAITGQSALSGSVDTANDLVLLYDNSSTSLTKVDVATLLASAGTGSFNDFNLAADTGTAEVVADGNTVTIAGGTGIDTVVSTSDTVTVAIDNTVITTSSSIGDLSDVDITTSAPTNGQALVWNATNNEFEPGTVASSTNYFQTIAVSGQSDVVPDSTTDTLNFAAGANITLTTDASTDTITIAATGGAANAFSTLAVAGQSNVVADSETDTLTLAAGTGMTITTDAGTDTITFTSSAGGGGSLPVILAGATSDPITLSDITVAGAIPFTNYDGTTDNIQLGSTQQAVTAFADNDADTSIEVERTSDNDTVYIKAGGTDVLTATSSGVTITNLTVTGNSVQANELKVTDTLFELNADGASLTTDAGMIVERGSTGDNAAFVWDESEDAWVAATTATDGSASSSLTLTEATLKAATQTQGDNSTNVATTAYVDTAVGSLSSNSITDADSDTRIRVEAAADEDVVRVDTAGQERLTIDNNVSMSARGGFFTHQLTMNASETFTIASTEGTVAAGPLDIQGTVDVQGSLVVL